MSSASPSACRASCPPFSPPSPSGPPPPPSVFLEGWAVVSPCTHLMCQRQRWKLLSFSPPGQLRGTPSRRRAGLHFWPPTLPVCTWEIEPFSPHFRPREGRCHSLLPCPYVESSLAHGAQGPPPGGALKGRSDEVCPAQDTLHEGTALQASSRRRPT